MVELDYGDKEDEVRPLLRKTELAVLAHRLEAGRSFGEAKRSFGQGER